MQCCEIRATVTVFTTNIPTISLTHNSKNNQPKTYYFQKSNVHQITNEQNMKPQKVKNGIYNIENPE